MFVAIGKGVKRGTVIGEFIVTVDYKREIAGQPIVLTRDHTITTKPGLVADVTAQLEQLKLAEDEAAATLDIIGKVIARI